MGIRIRSSCALLLVFLICAESGVSFNDHHEHHVSPSIREGPRCVFAKQFGYDGPKRRVRSIGRLPLNEGLSRLLFTEVEDEEDDGESPEDQHFRKQVQNARSKPTGMDPRGPDEVVEEDANGTLITRCLAKEKCFVFWNPIFDPSTNRTFNKVVVSGCWGMDMMKSSSSTPCQESRCINEHSPRKNGTRFCCCSGDLCNAVFKDNYVDAPPAPVVEQKEDSPHHHNPTPTMIGVTCGLSIFALIAIAFGIFFFVKHSRQAKELKKQQEEEMKKRDPGEYVRSLLASASYESLNVNTVSLGVHLAQGRYGNVVLGDDAAGRKVAVKLFPAEHREYFVNEWRAYNQPLMRNRAGILMYLGAGERPIFFGGRDYQYWLVVEYHQNQSLIDYLKRKTIDAATLDRMAISLAEGLAFLHGEQIANEGTKPAMVHRDLNSRNVLVRADLSLCICDMGFALAFKDSWEGQGSTSSSSEKSTREAPALNDVGTTRYMAPEMLEGSANLRDPTNALKQVDMYAFGLILWEMATRCSDLYQGLAVPDYQLPYQKEVGLNPSFSQMQQLVARKKARPLFPSLWKDTNSAVKFLKNTMEDCWDGDADARVTSYCVYERLQALPGLWHTSVEDAENADEHGDDAPRDVAERARLLNDVFVPPTKNVNEVQHLFEQSGDLPSMVPLRLQPHQGRNQCQERNLKPDSSEELTPNGNSLVGRKTGLKPSNAPEEEMSLNAASRVMENIENWVNRNANEEQALMSSGTADSGSLGGPLRRKVPNAVAAQKNQENRNSWMNIFRKKPTLNNLMSYRPVTIAASQNTAGQPTLQTTDETKCNIRNAAAASSATGTSILPQILRRDVTDSSGNTQVTCLSPSPSCSNGSPPLATGLGRTARFSVAAQNTDDLL